jgi:hypothetical protein
MRIVPTTFLLKTSVVAPNAYRRYVLTGQLNIRKRISIQGEGSDAVEIIVPQSPKGPLIRYDANNVFSSRTRLTTVAPGAHRGSNNITVSEPPSSAFIVMIRNACEPAA